MLEVRNLEVVYHGVVLVLKGVSLRVPADKIVCLLGPNGAGKTTMLRAITGLLDIHEGEVTKGTIQWDGESLVAQRPDAIVRRGVSQVMEGRRIFGDLTVEENLLAGGYTLRSEAARESMAAFFARFPVLGERRRALAGYLSGGEQQMLAIARALVVRPRLLLLDEPSLGLAPRVVGDVARLIREVHGQGVGILLVEQNAALALDIADYGYVMESGRIVIDGPTSQLAEDQDVREFYLGVGGEGQTSYREVKRYRRRRRWLS